jgi:hypothetical protein
MGTTLKIHSHQLTTQTGTAWMYPTQWIIVHMNKRDSHGWKNQRRKFTLFTLSQSHRQRNQETTKLARFAWNRYWQRWSIVPLDVVTNSTLIAFEQFIDVLYVEQLRLKKKL